MMTLTELTLHVSFSNRRNYLLILYINFNNTCHVSDEVHDTNKPQNVVIKFINWNFGINAHVYYISNWEINLNNFKSIKLQEPQQQYIILWLHKTVINMKDSLVLLLHSSLWHNCVLVQDSRLYNKSMGTWIMILNSSQHTFLKKPTCSFTIEMVSGKDTMSQYSLHTFICE